MLPKYNNVEFFRLAFFRLIIALASRNDRFLCKGYVFNIMLLALPRHTSLSFDQVQILLINELSSLIIRRARTSGRRRWTPLLNSFDGTPAHVEMRWCLASAWSNLWPHFGFIRTITDLCNGTYSVVTWSLIYAAVYFSIAAKYNNGRLWKVCYSFVIFW